MSSASKFDRWNWLNSETNVAMHFFLRLGSKRTRGSANSLVANQCEKLQCRQCGLRKQHCDHLLEVGFGPM